MTFLITGATGFIGRHLVRRLLDSGAAVRALVRPKAGRRPIEGVETVPGDLATGEGIEEALQGTSHVIHLAGTTKALHPADYETGNVIATGNLARAAAGRGIRLVYTSSLAAAGPSRDGLPLDEEAPMQPVSLYGRSKLRAEEALRRHMPEAVIVRPAVVYGPGDTDVFQLLKAISRGLVVEVSGGDRWFSAIYVADLVEALLLAAQTEAAAGRTYFLAHPKPATWASFGADAARLLHRRTRTLRVPAPLAMAVGSAAECWARLRRQPGIISRDKVREASYPYWTCSTLRASSELGFTAPTPLEEGLTLSLRWYRQAGWIA